MATKILKYNKSRKQFNLNFSGRHFIKRPTRNEEVKEINDWLIDKTPTEVNTYIAFEDVRGQFHEKVQIRTSKMQCWYNETKDGETDYSKVMWELPTRVGTVYIHSDDGKAIYCRIGRGYETGGEIKSEKVVVFNEDSLSVE